MNPKIESIHIRGFRSLADVRISDMSNPAILIGPNGSGKSNLIRFFQLMQAMLSSRLGEFVALQGGADDQLFGGSSRTQRMDAEITLRTDSGLSDYRFTLSYAHPDRFIFTDERYRVTPNYQPEPSEWLCLGAGHSEAKIVLSAYSREPQDDKKTNNEFSPSMITDSLRKIGIYQFHDTSDTSGFKKKWDLSDDHTLRGDGGNLAAMLYRLRQQDVKRYQLICRQIQRRLPGFDRFELDDDYGKVLLKWKSKWSDKTFGAHLTSDGSLRFFALTALLNLPTEMLPSIMILDEPELGLHPAAVSLLAGMTRSRSAQRHIIVATQSSLLVREFSLENIIVLDIKNGRTKFTKHDPADYHRWLDDGFTTGDLWQKNLLGGRP